MPARLIPAELARRPTAPAALEPAVPDDADDDDAPGGPALISAEMLTVLAELARLRPLRTLSIECCDDWLGLARMSGAEKADVPNDDSNGVPSSGLVGASDVSSS